MLDQIVQDLADQLALCGRRLVTHPHALLLYEADGFFLPNRGIEERDRWVATSVISLPGVFEGGTLVVRHKGESIAFDTAAETRFTKRYAASYADCEHEAKPLIDGLEDLLAVLRARPKNEPDA